MTTTGSSDRVGGLAPVCRGLLRSVSLLLIAVVAMLLAGAAAAAAAAPAPGWEVTTASFPTVLAPGGNGYIAVYPYNVGSVATTSGATITDTLPVGLEARTGGKKTGEDWTCSGHPEVCTTTIDEPIIPAGRAHNPTFLAVEVEPGAAESLLNRVVIAGGGAAAPAGTTGSISVGTQEAPFGIENWQGWFSNADGTIDTQAGSHPYSAMFVLNLNTDAFTSESGGHYVVPAGAELRNVTTTLPPGFVGDPTAVPECTRGELDRENLQHPCPASTQIGIAEPEIGGTAEYTPAFPLTFPIYNMVPPPGVAAEFAFDYSGIGVFLDATVRSGGDYGISEHIDDVPQRTVTNTFVTLWGVPGEASHNEERCGTIGGAEGETEACGVSSSGGDQPFLTLPTSCEGPLSTGVSVSAWENADVATARAETLGPQGEPLATSGCEGLQFGPSVTVAPDTTSADSPAGLTAEVKPPLGGLETVGGLSSADIKETTVTLPEGFAIDPGRAAGLEACPPSEDGLEPLPDGEENDGPPSCPPASRIGEVEIETPLLPKALKGDIYVLQSNPPEVKLLVAASTEGVDVKLVGIVHLDPTTGRLTTTFAHTPQLPFSSFKLNFEGAPRAALVTAATCGTYGTTAALDSWAEPFVPSFSSDSTFAILTGSGGSSCPSRPLPFTPTMLAGTTSPVAGASSAFALKVSKPDDQQNVKTIEATLPPGQLADLAGVPLCPDSLAPSGNCPSGSQVGTVGAEVGPGPDPLQVPQLGKAPTAAYLAGPYEGAPYSLVFKVPAQAGPFDLGTVAVRTALQVNETTTQVTALSDPLPQILDGVPLEYQGLTVSIDRPGFIRNPTDCEPMSISATIGGSEGASAHVSDRYQVGECASLAFKPSLKLSFSGQTKRTGNPAVKAVLTQPAGDNANIAGTSVILPKGMLIDNAHINSPCTRVQFNSTPVPGEGCPAKSILGTAKVWTPLLEKPLEGKVYFRSNGGERQLPDLVVALRGQINVQLVGFIDSVGKQGAEVRRVRTRFATVPDAPVSRFELDLSGGKKGLLENSKNLCKASDKANLDLTGQNGKTYDTESAVKVSCGGKSRRKDHKK